MKLAQVVVLTLGSCCHANILLSITPNAEPAKLGKRDNFFQFYDVFTMFLNFLSLMRARAYTHTIIRI